MTKSKGKQFINRYMPFETRFWLRVNKKHNDECWEWQGYISSTGYGQMTYKGRPTNVQRVSWIIHFGNISGDLHILHKCDNRKCVNPDHLFLGTNNDNIIDKVSKGRQSRGEERPASKLTTKKVKNIKELRKQGKTFKELSEIFGIAQGQLWMIVNGKAWKHV